MTPIKNLEPRHKAACRMRIQGLNNDEIAKELRVQKRTLYAWFSEDIVKDYLEDLARNVEMEFAVQLASAGMIAIRELAEQVALPASDSTITHGQRVQTAREILNRLPGTATIADRNMKPDPQGDTNYTAIFANMDDQQLAQFIANWKGGEDGAGGDAAPAIEARAKS